MSLQNLLTLAKENEKRFACLPPSRTHITQPLDVTFFLKISWRKTILKFKELPAGPPKMSLHKQQFAEL